MPTATSPPPLPPSMLAQRYRLERRLAQGGMAEVWLAIDTLLSRHVAMKLLNGKSLRQLLDEQKRLSPDLTMHIGSCVAAALDAAHQAGLVHRDVKPGNILITPDGRVLLTD